MLPNEKDPLCSRLGMLFGSLSPQIHMLKLHSSKWWHLEDCQFWGMGLGHKRRKVISGISTLIKQIPENFIVPSTMC